MRTIFQSFGYNDTRGAIRWVYATFGFLELFSAPDSGELVRHVQLQPGPNIIMLGSVRRHEGVASPQMLAAARQGFYVYVDDLDAHFKRARSPGVEITT